MHGGFTKAQVRKMSRADAALHLSSMFASWKAANSMRAFYRFGDLDMHWGDIDGWGHAWPTAEAPARLDDGCLLIAAAVGVASEDDVLATCG